MKRFLLALAFLFVAADAFAQTPATPASALTPAATASPDSGQRRDAQQSAVGGFAYQQPVTFEGGAQFGKTSDGASQVTFLARAKCTVNPAALGGPGASSVISCAATGAVAGDYAACSLPKGSASGVVIKSVEATTDAVEIEIVGIHDVFVDVGAVAIQCLVVR